MTLTDTQVTALLDIVTLRAHMSVELAKNGRISGAAALHSGTASIYQAIRALGVGEDVLEAVLDTADAVYDAADLDI